MLTSAAVFVVLVFGAEYSVAVIPERVACETRMTQYNSATSVALKSSAAHQNKMVRQCLVGLTNPGSALCGAMGDKRVVGF